MIHYHGTPIGGEKGSNKAMFYNGRHLCVSYRRPDDLDIICEVASSYFVDNGAFSFWRGGEKPDWDAYMEWLGALPRHPDFYIVPDTIDGTEEDNRHLLFRYGRAHGACPVYHMHESLEYLDMLVRQFPLVALGSSGKWSTPGTPDWWNRMAEMMDVICDTNGKPRTRIHGLRMLNPEIFSRIPFHSCDSTNAARNNNQKDRFGVYLPPTAAGRASVIADRIEAWNSAATWKRIPIQDDLFMSGGE